MYEDLYYDEVVASNAHSSSAIWRNFGAQYMRDIDQYKGTPYYELLLNNPYLSNGTEYTPSWWDANVRQLFGDYSQSDNFYASRNQQAQEYMSQIINSMTADQLNSPSAKVARDKAAGLNSDLVGVQAADSTASGVSPDEVPPTYPENSGQQAIDVGLQIAQVGSNFVKGIMEFGSMFMDMRGKSMSLAAQDFAINDNAYDLVLKFLAGSDHFQTKDDGSIAISPIDDSIYKELQDSLVTAYGDSFTTKRAKKILKHLRGRIMYDKDGKPTLAYQNKRAQMVAEFLENRQKGAKIASSKGYDDDFMTFVGNLGKYFTDMEYALEKAQNEAAQKIAKYQSDKYGYSSEGETLGTAEAKADIEEYRRKATKEALDNVLDSQFAEIKNYLQTECKGTWYGAIGMLLLPVARKLIEMFSSQAAGGIVAGAVKAIL